MTEDNVRFVARMQKNGNDHMGYLHTASYKCFSQDDNGEFISSTAEYPCQYLLIRDGCTVFYVDYELDTTFSANAVIGRIVAGGLPVYMWGLNGGVGSGYYIHGCGRLVLAYKIVTENVQLLVLL